MPTQSSDVEKRVNGLFEKIAIGALALIMAYQYNSIQTLEERVYVMQAEKFTSADAAALEDRLGKRIEAGLAATDNKLNTILYILGNGTSPKK